MSLSQLDRAKLKEIFSYLLEIADKSDNEFEIMDGCKEIVNIYENKQTNKKQYEIGEYYPEYGIYAGIHNQNHVFVAGEDVFNAGESEFTWDEAMKLAEERGVKLPRIGECMLITENLEAIQKGLAENGLDELNGWYWSSSEYSSNYSWYLCVHETQGLFNGSYKDNYTYVRPVLALPLQF